jgi:hypothetical protein
MQMSVYKLKYKEHQQSKEKPLKYMLDFSSN